MVFTVKNCTRSRVARNILLITVFILLGVFTFADIYKWVDEDGRVHFGDTPPQDVASERMQVRTRAEPANPDAGELQRQRLYEQARKDKARRTEEQREKAAAERAAIVEHSGQEERCLEARKQLAVLRQQLPIYRDEKGKFRAKWLHDTYQGERIYLDDGTRISAIAQTRQQVETMCQHPGDTEEQDIARNQWIRSEHCAAARADLELLEQPRTRAPRKTIEKQRQQVQKYCN